MFVALKVSNVPEQSKLNEAEFNEADNTFQMSRALKENDVLELSKLYEAEFNQAEIHDRILVFDVIGSASWQHNRQSKQSVEESDRNDDEESIQSEVEDTKTTTSGNEPDQTEKKKTGESTSDSAEKKTESHDYVIEAEHSQTDEKEASDEIKTHDMQTATLEASKTEVASEATKKESSALNENQELSRTTSHENDSKSLQDSEIIGKTDENLNSKEQSENDSETEKYGSDNPINEDEIIRQHKFYIHSSWLALQSSYFRSMFFSGMKESNAKEVHVQISMCEEKSHLMLLEAMYKIDTLDNASVDELLEVLRLAHKYDVKFVFKKCKYCLQAAVVSLEICEQIMRFIKIDNEVTDVEDLSSTLQSFLAKEFSPLDKTWQTTSFEELCEPSLRYLLSSSDLVAASENTVFHALIHWIEQCGLDNVSNGGGLPSLLSVVRFELMPIDYLYNIAQHNPVAKKVVDFNEHYLRGISYHALSEKIRQEMSFKPVERKGGAKSYVPYTWVIPTDKLLKLDGTEEELKSDEFWFCGYKMMLKITHVKKRDNYAGMFDATLCLEIINLTQQNVVEISWQPVSQSFNSSHGGKKHAFRKSACVSSADVVYTIETKQEEPSTSSTGFTFPSSQCAVTTTPSVFSPRTGSSAFGSSAFGSSAFGSSAFGSSAFGSSTFGSSASATQASWKCLFGNTASSQSIGPIFGSVQQAKPAVGFGRLNPCSTPNTNILESSGANSPKPESPTTPCLSIDVKMSLF